MVIMSNMITRLEYIMNTENPTSEEQHLVELPDFYHVKLKLTGKENMSSAVLVGDCYSMTRWC